MTREPLVLSGRSRSRSDRAATSGDETVDEQHDDRADDGADQARALARSIPSEGLPEIARDESADDAQDGGQDEPRRLVISRHEELGDYAGDETNDDGPQDTHSILPSD